MAAHASQLNRIRSRVRLRLLGGRRRDARINANISDSGKFPRNKRKNASAENQRNEGTKKRAKRTGGAVKGDGGDHERGMKSFCGEGERRRKYERLAVAFTFN